MSKEYVIPMYQAQLICELMGLSRSPSLLLKQTSSRCILNNIKDVIYNNPATIILWSDGTKTVVKCQPCDIYNPEIGLTMCVLKKLCCNKGNFNDIFNKWLPKEEKQLENCMDSCAQCGCIIMDNDIYCSHCGTKLK